MASSFSDANHHQSSANYMHKKRINELFEALMTALMVHKPDDHIAFLRTCLDKVEKRPTHISWDFFVSKSFSTADQPNLLPPVHSPSSQIPSFDPHISSKSHVLPPIEHINTHASRLPMIFVLSLSNPLRLCSKLLERYHQVTYLLINDMANIDKSEPTDLHQNDYRYDCIAHGVEGRRSQAKGFLIIGGLSEQNYLKQWQEKLGAIDLVLILSDHADKIISDPNFTIVQIDSTDPFEKIFSSATHSLDQLFPQDAFLSQRSETMLTKSVHSNLPILFCIDNHHVPTRTTHRERSSFDKEFQMLHDEKAEENNNSFIHTLCQCLGDQLGFKHIHYGDFGRTLLTFEELKNEIIESMSTSSGFIIDHFPTSMEDLHKFQSEIGPCSVLIYIGDPQAISEEDEVNGIIKKFKADRKALYVDCRKEVDEIYEDLKSEILKHI